MSSRVASGVVIGLGAAFFVAHLAAGVGEWDRRRLVFPMETGTTVRLAAGDVRTVHMTAGWSEPLIFDLRPYDLTCTAAGPDGAVALGRVSGSRLLDAWNEHWMVASLRAKSAGDYTFRCTGYQDVDVVLASPPRWTAGWASPQFALFVFVLVVLGVAAGNGVAALVRRPRRD